MTLDSDKTFGLKVYSISWRAAMNMMALCSWDIRRTDGFDGMIELLMSNTMNSLGANLPRDFTAEHILYWSLLANLLNCLYEG